MEDIIERIGKNIEKWNKMATKVSEEYSVEYKRDIELNKQIFFSDNSEKDKTLKRIDLQIKILKDKQCKYVSYYNLLEKSIIEISEIKKELEQ